MQTTEENILAIIKNNSIEIELLKKRCEQYSKAYDSLLFQLKELQRYRFGKRSERFVDPNQQQLDFFGTNPDDLPKAQPPTEPSAEDEHSVDAPPKRKKKKKTEKDIPIRIEVITVPEEQRQCVCGKCKKIIRYETKEILHHQRAIFELIEQRREVLACEDGCEGELVVAPAPLQVLPKIKATEEFLSFLVVSKLEDRQPLYHLEKQLYARHGLDCSRQTMARWLIDLIVPLQPIYNLLKDAVIEYDVAACDATTLQVLKEPGRAAETKSYMYCFRGGAPGQSVVLYEYNDKEHKQFVANWFADFSGFLQVDGDNFFEQIGKINKLANCNAHARRKFEPVAKATKGKGLAKEALYYFKQLYKIEREAKVQEMTPEQRHALRLEKSKPLMEKFFQWVEEKYPTTLPQSPLGKAMKYCLNFKQGLMRFLEDGRLEADNNLTEQQIKPFVIARKNFLFADTVAGANALSMHMSLIQTAKQHGHDPYHYYIKLLKSLPHCSIVEDYEKLLPWNLGKEYDGSG